MFISIKQPTPVESALDKAIHEATEQLSEFSTAEDGYKHTLDHIERLSKLRNPQGHRELLSPNVMAGAVANILGIGLILRHEQFNVITSKALGFVMKAKT